MQSVLFGLGIVGIIATWHFIWLPTHLDATRDRLFDLREKIRDEFSEKWDLSDPVYAALRDLLNSHLRYTEKSDIFVAIMVLSWLSKNPEQHRLFSVSINKRFETTDSVKEALVREARQDASIIMLSYMVGSSVTALLLSLIGLLFLLMRESVRSATQVFRRAVFFTPIRISTALASSAFLAAVSPFSHTDPSQAQVLVEECVLTTS